MVKTDRHIYGKVNEKTDRETDSWINGQLYSIKVSLKLHAFFFFTKKHMPTVGQNNLVKTSIKISKSSKQN